MNKKVSGGEALCIAIYIVAVSFFSLVNATILKTSGNSSLLAFIISTILGLIPVFMIMHVSKKIDTSLLQFLKDKFSFIGNVITIILIILTIFLVFIFSWMFLDFVMGQFLTKTSYYFISISLFIFVFYAVKMGIEVISRTTFILFVFSFIILMFFLGTLIPYTELNNLKPYIDSNINSIIKSIFITVSTTSFPLILILNIKKDITNKEKFPRKILFGYLIGMAIMFLFILFTILIYGIDFSKILTYPTYSLFKKVEMFGFIERIENIVSIIFFAGFYAAFIYYIYFITDNIKELVKIKSKKMTNILIFIISLGISTLSVYLFKNCNIEYLINYSYYIISIYFIILVIIFIRCLFIRTNK